ncbi:hypothetical protein EVA_15218 [gut metagenome]|uniref:Uncharacterized protein n=1 Tax=gut metagenome TaxID=749906 RepID=J9FP16_9ZZZZ
MVEKGIFKTRAQDTCSTAYHFQLAFYVFQENGTYVSYCPSLDISSSGRDFREAVENFYKCFQLHIDCCMKAGTLHDDLLVHGWNFTKSNVAPPAFSVLMKKPEMKKLMNSDLCFERVVTSVRLPLFA